MDTNDLSDRIDDVGIGILASPYLAEAASLATAGTPKLHGFSGAAHRFYERFHGKPYGEIAGLALVAPSVTHGLAGGIQKVLPDKIDPAPPKVPTPQAAAPMPPKVAAYCERAFLAGFRKVATELSAGGYTEDEARKLYRGQHRDIEEVTDGLNDELEHRDITHGRDDLTKKIVDAHLRDDPHYYEKLRRAGL